MDIFTTDIIRILIAVLIGAVIGSEREYRSKSAGFRTMILVCAGSCLFTLMSQYLGENGNTDRIAANIVTGIGFLGAGVIFKESGENRVNGITTATSIWMIAALGMAVGGGYLLTACLGTIIMFIVLRLFVYVQNVISRLNHIRNYKISCIYKQETLHKYEGWLKQCGLKPLSSNQSKAGEMITGCWLVQGSEKNHNRFIQLLLNDDEIKEFAF